jgi:hypothetical protein
MNYCWVYHQMVNTLQEFGINKYIAQSIIYSRASGIDGNNFFTNVTVEEFYNLMAWVHWSRDVMYVKNGKAAAEGGVMMAKILQALSSSSRSSSNHEEEYDAAFIIGHDGDLNAVATALGITWTLPPPYHPGYLPTPPGSALHFAYDGNEVEISFIAPVLFADHTMTLNTSGTLIEVPVKFDSYDTECRGGSVTIVPSLYALKEQTRNSLSEYNGAMECFVAAEKIYSLNYNQWQDSAAANCSLFVGGLLVYAVSTTVLLLFFCLRKQSKRIEVTSRNCDGQRFTGIPVIS